MNLDDPHRHRNYVLHVAIDVNKLGGIAEQIVKAGGDRFVVEHAAEVVATMLAVLRHENDKTRTPPSPCKEFKTACWSQEEEEKLVDVAMGALQSGRGDIATDHVLNEDANRLVGSRGRMLRYVLRHGVRAALGELKSR